VTNGEALYLLIKLSQLSVDRNCCITCFELKESTSFVMDIYEKDFSPPTGGIAVHVG
jgi:hypothetical protein